MSADSRSFVNPFQDHDVASKEEILDVSSGETAPAIHASFALKLNGWCEKLLELLSSSLPRNSHWDDGSVYTGTAGIIMMYLQLHKTTSQQKYLKSAQQLLERLAPVSRHHRVSLPCGVAGQLAVEAVLHHRTGNADRAQRRVHKVLALSEEVRTSGSLPDELLYGRVGYLAALLYLRSELPAQLLDGLKDAVSTTVAAVLESGELLSRELRSPSPLMFAWHEKCYLGAAHGLSGIVALLLQVPEALSASQLGTLVRPTVDYLAGLRLPSGNYPSSLESSSDRLVHWCHGAPGFSHLFCLAFKVFGDERYLQLARGCADVVWRRGLLRKGYGLCHGAAGNAYTFLHLFQLTKEPAYLYRACRFAQWCSEYGKHGCRTPDRPLSLFEGLAGTVYFLCDLRRPQQARFPGFCF